MPEHDTQSFEASPTKMLIARICLLLLLGMFFASLFGDFIVWAIYGTKFILSPQFHKLLPYFQGSSGILILLFVVQAKQDWKRGKPHLALLGFIALIAGGIPLAPLVAIMISLAARVGMAVFNKPMILPMTLLLMVAAACKIKTIYSIWKLGRPAFQGQNQHRQDHRRIVISK